MTSEKKEQELENVYLQEMLERYNNNKNKLILIKPNTYYKIVKHKNISTRIKDLIDYMPHGSVRSKFVKKEFYGKIFTYEQFMDEYYLDGEIIGYKTRTKVVNPYDSKVPTESFIQRKKEEPLEDIFIDLYAAAQKYDPDEKSFVGKGIEELLLKEDFIIDIFKFRKYCEKIIKTE